MTRKTMVEVGKKYGFLTMLSEVEPYRGKCGKKKAKRMASAACDCGVIKVYRLHNITHGGTISCGCNRIKKTALNNAKLATPQVWEIDGDTAFIFIKGEKVLIDPISVPLVNKYKWHIGVAGYVESIPARKHHGTGRIHRIIMGLLKGDIRVVDHINHSTTDNRKSNLRIATNAQNSANSRLSANNTTGYKGVTIRRGRYAAQICVMGKRKIVGRFDCPKQAALAYDAAAVNAFGEFAYLNFPEMAGAST